MPLVRIALRRRKTPQFGRKVGEAVYRTMVEILGVPVYRGAWPGGRAFVVAAGDAEVAAALDQRSATGPPAIDRKEWLLAAGVAATARPPDGLLLALGEADRDGNWLRLLPVVARTSSLFVPVGEDREELVALAAQQPCLDRSQIDGVALCNMKILRWPVRVAIAPSLRERVLAGGAAPNP